jgi:hypothetical protein
MTSYIVMSSYIKIICKHILGWEKINMGEASSCGVLLRLTGNNKWPEFKIIFELDATAKASAK